MGSGVVQGPRYDRLPDAFKAQTNPASASSLIHVDRQNKTPTGWSGASEGPNRSRVPDPTPTTGRKRRLQKRRRGEYRPAGYTASHPAALGVKCERGERAHEEGVDGPGPGFGFGFVHVCESVPETSERTCKGSVDWEIDWDGDQGTERQTGKREGRKNGVYIKEDCPGSEGSTSRALLHRFLPPSSLDGQPCFKAGRGADVGGSRGCRRPWPPLGEQTRAYESGPTSSGGSEGIRVRVL